MTPDEIYDMAKSYAEGIKTEAMSAITTTLNNLSTTYNGSGGVWTPEYQDLDEFDKTDLDKIPDVTQISLELPPEPNTNVAYQGISSIEYELIPEFNIPTPTFTEPQKPSQLAEFNQVSPTINTEFDFPEIPYQLQNPLLPDITLTDHVVPEKPELLTPNVDIEVPQFSESKPDDLRTVFESSYSGYASGLVSFVNGYVDAQLVKINPEYHAQMSKLEVQLTKYLDGGTALRPEVEDAIYSRARGKNNAEARRVRDQAFADAAARGFTMPTGALMSAMQQARQAGADNNARAASEITVMQAEMEQKNLQFAVTTSSALRSTIINAMLSYMQNLIQINGQAADLAKTVMNAVIEGYNLLLKYFGARMDEFKAQSALAELKFKAVGIKLELYRGELSALETMVNVDKSKVDIYRAKVEALSSLANLYKSQIEAVLGRASLEKLKLDLFRSQVEAHSQQVQAKNSEWQGFTAQINGQQAAAGLYSAQVQGYGQRVQAFKTQIDAQAEVVRAQVATNQAAADQVKTAANVYQSIVQARSTEAGVKMELEKLKLSTHSEQLKSQVTAAQLALDYYKSKTSVALSVMDARVKHSATHTSAAVEKMKSLGTVGVAGASILGSLAGSAMAGMNMLAATTETI